MCTYFCKDLQGIVLHVIERRLDTVSLQLFMLQVINRHNTIIIPPLSGFVQLRENLKNVTFSEKIRGNLENSGNFLTIFYNLREYSGNFILPNISDQIGCAIRINE